MMKNGLDNQKDEINMFSGYVVNKLKSNLITKQTFGNISVTVLFPLLFFLVIPLQIYIANSDDLLISLFDMFFYCFVLFVLATIFFVCFGLFMSTKLYGVYQSFLFSIGILVWLQSNFLFIKTGVLNGLEIDMSTYQNRIGLNCLIWVLVPIAFCFLGLKYCEFIKKLREYGSIILVLMQIVVLFLTLLPAVNQNSTKQFLVTTAGINELSNCENSILIIMDMYDDTYFTEVLEKNPDFVNKLDGFVRYTNITGKYSTTIYSVPYLISQQLLLNQEKSLDDSINQAYTNSKMLNEFINNKYRIQIYTQPRLIGKNMSNNFYNVMLNEGDVNVSQPVSFAKLIIKLSALRSMPDILKTKIFLSTEEFSKVVSSRQYVLYDPFDIYPYLNWVNNSLTTIERPVFTVFHVKGAHYPYVINENIELVEENSITYYEQALGALKAVVIYLENMKKAGVYDNSTIIITADHGYYNGAGLTSPVLLVKNKNSRGLLEVNDTVVSHDDIDKFFLEDAGLVYEEDEETKGRLIYLYELTGQKKNGKFPLVEWIVDDKSNKPESFSRTGYYIDVDGQRRALSKYNSYTFGEYIHFGIRGNAQLYFDYGLGAQSSEYTRLIGNEAKITFSHQPINEQMLLTITFANSQNSSTDISLSCNGKDCGQFTLVPQKKICQFVLPKGCLDTNQSELIIRFNNLDEVDLAGATTNLLYHNLILHEYNEEQLIDPYFVPSKLSDYSSEIVSYTISKPDLFVNVKNTSSCVWTFQDDIRCYIRIDGQDSGIRTELLPFDIVKPGDEYVFCFKNFDPNKYEDAVIEVQMVQELFAYFGDIAEIEIE